ncbi:ornithine carbamoyltransferase [Coraliomargarita akajimensis]|uniref:Ornithine carbamoyltransferase n=1 Tax=Coraliomargarita akajimensis (strain DSM 45221 / IAM 15411 / JCM 23193 / KCTC 12865 / 04OKA010-24) TaxID=583355 RepID=D5EL85_CORAD|nr:ornithine carbamoyltransferase [Coraliomargarita akajimensis]ADE53187.1 ornithine carbamoyltransferase [Coraliomargarita akajimensis DSM 45221]
MNHFLKETDFTLEQAQEVFALAKSFKENRLNCPAALNMQSWGLLFYKSSTRTRISFEVGVNELGGFPVVLNSSQTQINRGETIADSAQVMSRYLHGLVIRTFGHDIVEGFAEHGSIPIVNGLTDFNHPCQLYTDLMSVLERIAPDTMDINALKGKKVAFFGDCASNMANSWIMSAAMFGMEIALAGPDGFAPEPVIDDALKADGLPVNYSFTTDAAEAAKDADILYTDVWVSMGDEAQAAERKAKMMPYQVTSELMALAKQDAVFMHCLPAHAGEEVTQEVLDSPQSIIFDEAENRLHAQKAIMAKLVELNS